VEAKAIGFLAARTSVQGAVVQDEGLALLNRYSHCLQATDALMLKLKAAEVVPYSVLSRIVPVAHALWRLRSNPAADILERLCALRKQTLQ
jgi:hypothetical protein